MTTLQTRSLTEIAVEQLHSSRRILLGFIETLSDEQLTLRVGGVGNHAVWIMGHLAWTDDLFVCAFRKEASCLPDGHSEQFSAGTVPSDNASDYPRRDELLHRLTIARKRTVEWAEELDEETAWQASPEALVEITQNAISAVHTLALHEVLHAGQITTIRASLGMKPLFA